MSRFIQRSALTLILLGLTTTGVRADLTITLDNVTAVAPGSVGTMNISVTSDASDTLSEFNLELLITQQNGTTSLLQFLSGLSQPVPYGDPNYVFSGESFGGDISLPFWGEPSSSPHGTTFDTISGGDTDDGSTGGYVTLGSTLGTPNTYFLASVQFSAPMGATPGDQFQISVVNDPGHTYFYAQNDPLLNLAHGPVLAYTVAPGGGLVTVSTSVAATPEPATMTMALISLGGLLGYGCSRRIARSWISSGTRIKSSLS